MSAMKNNAKLIFRAKKEVHWFLYLRILLFHLLQIYKTEKCLLLLPCVM